MYKLRPLSKREDSNIISFFKLNKAFNFGRNNVSSLARRNSYNSPKLFKTVNILSRNKNKETSKLFSLLDINDKITNSRGTSLPSQYLRLTDEENQRLFGFSYRISDKYDKKDFQPKSRNKSKENINLTESLKNTENKRKIKRCKSDIGDQLKMTKNNFFNKYIKENENKENLIYNNDKIQENKIDISDSNKEFEIYNLKKNPIKLTKAFSAKTPNAILKHNNQKENENNKENKSERKKISENNKKDRWFPKGLATHELLIKHPKLFAKKLKIEYSVKNNFSTKKILENQYKSDIFFFKPPTEKEISFKSIKSNRNFQNSDIFNIKNDTQSVSKSGETYLFKNNAKIKYNASRESNSYWNIAKNDIPTLFNSSSKEYNILNPDGKGISLGKEKIVIECENRKDKNSNMINNENYMNPSHRRKGITEYIDITRNGGSNPGRDYMSIYQKNPKCFYKDDGVCSSFYNLHFHYKNLCKKPFNRNFFD